MEERTFECASCGHIWKVEPCSEGGKHGYEIPCPECSGISKLKVMEDGTRSACGGKARGHGGGNGCGCRHHGNHQ